MCIRDSLVPGVPPRLGGAPCARVAQLQRIPIRPRPLCTYTLSCPGAPSAACAPSVLLSSRTA
eukprot:4866378-Prymnesium_polylepis.1